MSSNGRRPARPGIMPGGGAGQGAWVPGVNMPPLGYGLVAQQPHMAPPQPHMAPHQPLMAPPQQAWQQQQQQQQHFLAQQAGLAGTIGVATLTQQQQQQKYPPQHMQQQWMEVHRRAAEEQRKLYEQMMKQRQFDEQKMRLKAFNASKKTGVSADTMIESILGGKEPSKQRSPQPPKKNGGVEEQGGQGNHHQATASVTSQGVVHRQGTAVDWTKLENVNTLFASPKKTSTTAATTTTTGAEHPMQPHHDTTTTTPTPANPTGSHNPSLRPQTAAPLSMGDNVGKQGNGRKEGKNPIVLPQWMKDTVTLPEVYKRAVGLVGAAEGWVDTSRAYMLLMKTGLPPPFLGVLWEMVNCTTPGRLTQMEFAVLLALVALVQAGQPISGPDVLSGISEPIMPLIDHPALTPLVQDYLQARQKQQQQQGRVAEAGAGGSAGGGGGGGGVEGTTQAQTNTVTATNSNNCDDDEFDDFVGATVPSSASIPSSQPQTSSLPSSGFPTPSVPPPQPQPTSSFPNPTFPPPPVSLMGQPQTVPLPPGPSLWPQVAAPRAQAPAQTQAGDKNKAMNLPKLGFSPEPSPTTSFDDDFDDFQSAAIPCVSQAGVFAGGQHQGGQDLTATTPATTTTATPATSTPAMPSEQPLPPPVLQPEKPAGAAGEDKYAVFREIAEVTEQTTEVTENADDSFGEFCSSEVASLSLAQNASSSASASSAQPGLLQCQSASGTSNTSPISFEVYSTPPEVLPDTQMDAFEADFSTAFASTSTSTATATKPPDNYADIHEAMKRAEAEQKRKEESKWNDPFGEFEEAPPPLPGTAATAAPVATSGGVSGGSGATSSLPSAMGLSGPWANVVGGTEEDEDEDFGDFMGHSGIGGGSSMHTLPPPPEHLGETQSVASLELPGLEMTVGVEASEGQGGTDLFLQSSRGDIGTVEDQLGALSLDSATTAGGGGTASSTTTTTTTPQQQQQQQPSTTAGHVMDSYCSGGGLVDKYSIIREEASRDMQHHGEAHTGSWERCLEGIIKVLQEAHSILSSLNTTTSTTTTTSDTTTNNATTTSLKNQVLSTSQMQDYLANVHEVWLVCGRIRVSSRRVTTSVRVDNLLSQAQVLWRDILAAAGADSVIAKPPLDPSATTSEEGDNQMGEGEVCGVCLTGGGSRLTYGGHSYHPPCANLWLNCVDLLLPSLTPVTLL